MRNRVTILSVLAAFAGAGLAWAQAAAQAAGLYGCAFDASGASTACGAAVVDDKGDALVVTVSR